MAHGRADNPGPAGQTQQNEAELEEQSISNKPKAHERIAALVDTGSFQEVDAFLTHRFDEFGMADKKVEGDSAVTGFAKIDGRSVTVFSQDFAVMGGSFSEAQSQKICKIIDLALDTGVPIIGLNASVGARIQEGVYSLGAYAELFWRNTQASGVVPQISVMLGPNAGGSVYSPALTDFVIMTAGTSYMFITGPDVIKTVTREEVDFETLGGAHVHTHRSGVAHFAAQTEAESLQLVRRLLTYLPSNNTAPLPVVEPTDDPRRMDPELNSIVPTNPAETYDMHEVIARVFDRGSFLEVHRDYAGNAVVGFARLHGYPVGIVGQQPSVLAGVIDINASDKMARHIRFCDAFNLPIISLVDSPGFMPGVDQEHDGIIRHGAKIVYAYSEATVPLMTIVLRKAYGGAYIVMGSKYIRADLCLAWPTAEIAVMGVEGAVSVVYRKTLAKTNDPEERQRLRRELEDQFREKFANPYAAARSGHIDEVLIPAETRPRLIAALELLRTKQRRGRAKKHGNIPL